MLRAAHGLTVVNENFTLALTHREPARVIVSVPHDGLIGNDFTGVFEPRRNGIHGRDANVWPLINDIVMACAGQGCRIHAYRLLMPRAYIDGNRPLPHTHVYDESVRRETALDDPVLKEVYEHYHSQLANALTEAVQTYGRENVLFLDMHGFRRQPDIAPPRGYDVILGTGNRTTILHGEPDCALAATLRSSGFSVFLPDTVPVHPRGDPYSAGHNTRYYAQEYTVNAIQVEMHSSFRRKECGARGTALAHAFVRYLIAQYQ